MPVKLAQKTITTHAGLRPLLLLLALLLIGGCATRKEITGFQEDTRVMRSDMEKLKDQQRLILEAMSTLDSDIREMRARSEYGSSALEERVEQVAAQLTDILTRMDRSLAPLEELMRKEAANDTSKTAIGVDVFDAAMQDLSLGNYDLAEIGFLQFLQENPNSQLRDEARYGLGETFYARARYEDAASEYTRVINSNQMGKKTPAALLKLGLCFRATGRMQDARLTWQRLIDDFPNREEAMVAKQRLEELRGQ